MAPETMVVAVVAKDNWKRKAALIGPIRGSFTVGSTKKLPHPINGVVHGPFPKLRANPNIQYVSPPSTTSATFFIMMFTSFLMDTHPDSSIPKPKTHVYCSVHCSLEVLIPAYRKPKTHVYCSVHYSWEVLFPAYRNLKHMSTAVFIIHGKFCFQHTGNLKHTSTAVFIIHGKFCFQHTET